MQAAASSALQRILEPVGRCLTPDKGPNLTGIDPDTGVVVLLFHPRRDAWDEHFSAQGAMVIGRTPWGGLPCACST